jgi:hypothetical protein
MFFFFLHGFCCPVWLPRWPDAEFVDFAIFLGFGVRRSGWSGGVSARQNLRVRGCEPPRRYERVCDNHDAKKCFLP